MKLTSAERAEKNKGKFYLNKKTGTLHIVGGCHHSKLLLEDDIVFATEDHAISSETRYMKHCKNCFKK